jgi:hypothetical protein
LGSKLASKKNGHGLVIVRSHLSNFWGQLVVHTVLAGTICLMVEGGSKPKLRQLLMISARTSGGSDS